MAKSGIAIYGINYWPEPTGIGPYTAELAEHLAKIGHEVSVFTTFQHYPNWRVKSTDARRWRRRENLRGVEVTRLWSWMPIPMTGARRLLFEASYTISALLHGPGSAKVVVGVIPGLGSGIAAALHGTLRRRRVVIIVQDLAGAGLIQSGVSKSRLLGSLARRAEVLAVRSAEQIIVISEAFVGPLVRAGVESHRISVLANWGRMQMGESERPEEQSVKTVLHAGSMGAKQGLDQAVELARYFQDHQLPHRVLIVGDGSDKQKLLKLGAGIANVEFQDSVREEELPQLLSSADVLLISQAPTNVDMSFPSKLSAYFAANRPVVAAVPLDGTVAAFLTEQKAGVVVESGDVVGLANVVLELFSNRPKQRWLTENANQYLQKHWGRTQLLEAWSHAIQGS